MSPNSILKVTLDEQGKLSAISTVKTPPGYYASVKSPLKSATDIATVADAAAAAAGWYFLIFFY